MRKGKCVAQGCHASVKVCLQLERNETTLEGYPTEHPYWEWVNGLQTKICVSVNSEQELIDIYNKAKAADLPCSIITDAGKTEFGGVPTKTACAVGPADEHVINSITGALKLL
jgi:PTH2 family peptidyl-tRNA hydrolase